jgi:hypothetical protein
MSCFSNEVPGGINQVPEGKNEVSSHRNQVPSRRNQLSIMLAKQDGKQHSV